jgi:hypothetical protein
MKTNIIAVLMSASLYAPLAIAAENAAPVTADRISVFKVPLVVRPRRRSVAAALRNRFF